DGPRSFAAYLQRDVEEGLSIRPGLELLVPESEPGRSNADPDHAVGDTFVFERSLTVRNGRVAGTVRRGEHLDHRIPDRDSGRIVDTSADRLAVPAQSDVAVAAFRVGDVLLLRRRAPLGSRPEELGATEARDPEASFGVRHGGRGAG